jgi:hypothetical protein
LGATLAVLLSCLGGLIALATAVGAWAAFKVGRNTQTVRLYREAADAWQRKSEAQDVEIADLQGENGRLAARVAALEGKAETLTELVTGKAAIDALTSKVEHQHRELMLNIDSIKEVVFGDPKGSVPRRPGGQVPRGSG